MKVKTWIPLVLALVLGLFAAVLARSAMSRSREKPAETGVVPTVVAARDIAPGERLTATDLAPSKAPAALVPTGSFQNPGDLADRVALTGMVRGQAVLENLLAPIGTAAGVQALIPPGMRAITLQVNEFSGLAGLLVPGCRVDIISVIRNDEQRDSIARTIVQNVEVRAVGRQVAPTTPPPAETGPGAPPVVIANNVTLLVTPEQAEAVQLASVGGSPWLVLRNSKDDEPFVTDGTSTADLRGDKGATFGPDSTKLAFTPPALPEPATPVFDPFAEKARAKRTRTVTFIRATKEESMQVEVAPTPPASFLNTTSTDTNQAAPQ